MNVAELGLLAAARNPDASALHGEPSCSDLNVAADVAAMSEDGETSEEAAPALVSPRGVYLQVALLVGCCMAAALLAAAAGVASTPEVNRGPAPSRMASVVISGAEACHTAKQGEYCFDKVVWAATVGFHDKPENYRGLTPSSTFTDFQAYFHKVEYGNCSKPCPGPGPDLKKLLEPANCLCLFDVDRTLTGKQSMAAKCPGNQAHPGVFDSAFGGGDLVLSDLSLNLKSTFCGKCHLGVVSAGSAGGPEMKAVLQGQLPGAGNVWSGPSPITSPLVIGCGDAVKAQCAKGIVEWYQKQKHVTIAPKDVHFFDDHTGNVNGFGEFGYNARQVSCGSREGIVGLCGGQVAEVVDAPGIAACR